MNTTDNFNLIRTHSGWKNYPTWAAGLYMDNEYAVYMQVVSIMENTPPHARAERLRKYYYHLCLNTTSARHIGLSQALVKWGLSLIDWHALAEHYDDHHEKSKTPYTYTVPEDYHITSYDDFRNEITAKVWSWIYTRKQTIKNKIESFPADQPSDQIMCTLERMNNDDQLEHMKGVIDSLFINYNTRRFEWFVTYLENGIEETNYTPRSDIARWALAYVDTLQLFEKLGYSDTLPNDNDNNGGNTKPPDQPLPPDFEFTLKVCGDDGSRLDTNPIKSIALMHA